MRTRSRRRSSEPMLLGKPSPSLAKMKIMSGEELTIQIECLVTETNRLRRKIEHLKIQNPVPQKRIDNLARQSRRLAALTRAARERMDKVQEQES